MASEVVVVSAEEVSQLEATPYAKPGTFEKAKSSVPVWGRVGMWFLVPVMPLLVVVALVLRIAFRQEPRNVRYAWNSFLSTLLMASGAISTVAIVLILSYAPVPSIVNDGLPDLDERNHFISLPSEAALSSSDVSGQLKPLVFVVSPASRRWNHEIVASPYLGAGVLIFGDKTGYLIATANHVVRGEDSHAGAMPKEAMVTNASGVWSSARVVATSPSLDLALLWVGRHSGTSEFLQPITQAHDGETVSVIGHPEGLKYTLSTGIISSIRNETLQVSAAISPGNSGGPVYDDHGNLLGIVSSKFDNNVDPNAENIGFAVKSNALLESAPWEFASGGKELWQKFATASARTNVAPQTPTK